MHFAHRSRVAVNSRKNGVEQDICVYLNEPRHVKMVEDKNFNVPDHDTAGAWRMLMQGNLRFL